MQLLFSLVFITGTFDLFINNLTVHHLFENEAEEIISGV